MQRMTKTGMRELDARAAVVKLDVENARLIVTLAHQIPLVRPDDVLAGLRSGESRGLRPLTRLWWPGSRRGGSIWCLEPSPSPDVRPRCGSAESGMAWLGTQILCAVCGVSETAWTPRASSLNRTFRRSDRSRRQRWMLILHRDEQGFEWT